MLLFPAFPTPPFYGSPTHNIKGGWWLALVCLVHRHTTIKGAPVAWTPKPRLCHATKTWERKSVSGVVFSQHSTLLLPATIASGGTRDRRENLNNKGGAPPLESDITRGSHSPNRPRHKPRKTQTTDGFLTMNNQCDRTQKRRRN